jgi:hypothetical protein
MAWTKRKWDKDNPCEKDCPERSPTCHSTCTRGYKEYRARKDAECDARVKTAELSSYETAGSKRIAREAMMDKKRGY